MSHMCHVETYILLCQICDIHSHVWRHIFLCHTCDKTYNHSDDCHVTVSHDVVRQWHTSETCESRVMWHVWRCDTHMKETSTHKNVWHVWHSVMCLLQCGVLQCVAVCHVTDCKRLLHETVRHIRDWQMRHKNLSSHTALCVMSHVSVTHDT